MLSFKSVLSTQAFASQSKYAVIYNVHGNVDLEIKCAVDSGSVEDAWVQLLKSPVTASEAGTYLCWRLRSSTAHFRFPLLLWKEAAGPPDSLFLGMRGKKKSHAENNLEGLTHLGNWLFAVTVSGIMSPRLKRHWLLTSDPRSGEGVYANPRTGAQS